MRAMLIIAAREIREKARLFWISAGFALVPFAASLLPGARGNAEEVIAVAGRLLAIMIGFGIAVTLGASTITRDLTDRRISFFFTKPVSASALWIGKAGASLLLSVACYFLVATPSMLATSYRWGLTDRTWHLLAVCVMFTIFCTAHVLATILRSRSPLLVLDFLFLILSLAAFYLIVRPLILGGAGELLFRGLWILFAAVMLVLAVAPVWQLANGRSDIRRNHAALMRFLWPSIAVVLLFAGGIVAWLVHVSPPDIAVTRIGQPGRGTLVLVGGTAPRRMDYQATFLIDRADGSFRRIASPPWWGWQFSGDGKIAVWAEPVLQFSSNGPQLERLELHTTDGATRITMAPAGASFVLSDDGSRVAITNGSLLTVYELGTGRILASAAGLDGHARQQVFFVTPDLVRVIEKEDRLGTATPLRVFELDVRARTTRKTGERVIETARTAASVSGDGSRMLIHGASLIADGRTAETIATIAAPHAVHSTMLHDGRVALITFENGVAHLRTFERDGTPRHVIPFPNVKNIWFSGETENGKLILAAFGRTMYVVDLASGAIERRLEGVRGPLPRTSVDPRLMRYAADQELAGIDENGKLIVWKNEGRTAVRPLLPSR